MDDWPQWRETDAYIQNDEREEKAQVEKPVANLQLSDAYMPIDESEERVLCAAVGNDVFAIALLQSDRWVLRINDTCSGDVYEPRSGPVKHKKNKKGSDVHNIFIDPTGQHILLALTSDKSGETWYINTSLGKAGKPEKIERIKSRLTAVGWNRDNKRESSTGHILLGDNRGMVYIARFEKKEGCTVLTHAYDLARQIDSKKYSTITGIRIEKLGVGKRLVVLISTATRLCVFTGGPTLEDVFNAENLLDPFTVRSQVPQDVSPHAGNLYLHRPKVDDKLSPRCSVAWCSAGGIYHAIVSWPDSPGDPVLQNGSFFSLMKEGRSLPGRLLTSQLGMSVRPDQSSQSLAVEKVNHIILGETTMTVLLDSRVCIIAQPAGLRWRADTEPHDMIKPEELKKRLIGDPSKSQQNAFAFIFDENEHSNKPYLVTTDKLHELEIPEQSSDSWKSFLLRAMNPDEQERGQYFVAAADMCTEPKRKEQIQMAAADYYFEEREYTRAAKTLATTNAAFEDTAMKFVQCGDRKALLLYLRERITFIESRRFAMEQEGSQTVCLYIWASKVMLDIIAESEDSNEREDMRAEFHSFLSHISRRDIYHTQDKVTSVLAPIVDSYGMPDEMLYFLSLTKDYKSMMSFYMTHEKYQAALTCLINNCMKTSLLELWYVYCPRLITKTPVQVVDAWIGKAANMLEPSRLIPALLLYHPRYNPPGDTENQAVRYLKWLVKDSTEDPAINNMLILVYVQQYDDETELLQFLESFDGSSYAYEEAEPFDKKYALRLCLQGKRYSAAALIYSTMRMHGDAVTLSLQSDDIPLAKKLANCADDEVQKKQLWIQIVEHTIKMDKMDARIEGVKKAIDMVQECPALHLEDILPLFGDSVTVADFSNVILEALADYNFEIENLKREMHDMTTLAQTIAVNTENRKGVFIAPDSKCKTCNAPLLSKNFFIFGLCDHGFHQSCLTQVLLKSEAVPFETRDRIKGIHRQLERSITVEDDEQDTGPRPRDFKKELDEILGGQCPMCGELLITEATKPFGSEQDDSWKL
eukprot:TRINITY_DN6093_c0_g2_i1.p1 TRINITY_DN6093_c0_g2~~TRINITY_DN6093_c0_g2_i1.p1  ORF type:complete len:1039 (+),score=235.70 TRINITY_DN6093_c0_g2_i1:40-3156(+)